MSNALHPQALELFERSRRTPPRLVNSASASLYLYGVVGQDFTAASVAEALQELEPSRGPVTLYVNSPGGDYFAGKAMLSAISRFAERHQVRGVVDGIAASAASLLLMAASRVEMSPGSTMMVHEVQGAAAGRAQDLEAQAAFIRGETEQLAGIYARRTGLPIAEVSAMLAAETFMTAEQAVANHFADGIVGQKSAPKNVAPDLARRANALRISQLRNRASAGAPSASREQ